MSAPRRRVKVPKSKAVLLREQERSGTRQRILQAAGELFAKGGVWGVTIEDIAKAAGTSRVTVCSHFPRKPDIVHALIDELMLTTERIYEAFASLNDWSRDSLRSWLVYACQEWSRQRNKRSLVLSEMPLKVRATYKRRREGQIAILTRVSEPWQHFTPDEAKRRAFIMASELHQFLDQYHDEGWMDHDREGYLQTLADIWYVVLNPPPSSQAAD